MILKKKTTLDSGALRTEFQKLVKAETQPCITKLQGSYAARFVVLTTYPDLSGEHFWSGHDVSAFVHLLGERLKNFNYNKDLLCVPCTFTAHSNKRKKAPSSDSTLKFLQLCAQAGKQIICAGPKPFAQVFRQGSTPDADMLCGYWLYPEQLDGAAVFVFPDSAPLGYSDDKDSYGSYLEYKRAMALYRKTHLHYSVCLDAFTKSVSHGGSKSPRGTELDLYKKVGTLLE